MVFTKARASARAAKTVEKPTKPAEKPRSPSSVQNLPRVTVRIGPEGEQQTLRVLPGLKVRFRSADQLGVGEAQSQ